MSARRDVERALKAAFTATNVDPSTFNGLQPPRDVLAGLEEWIESCASPADAAKLSDCVLEITAFVVRNRSAEVVGTPIYGRTSAWLLMLRPIVEARVLEADEIRSTLWPQLIRRALSPTELTPPMHVTAVEAAQGILEQIWRWTSEARPDAIDATWTPLELDVYTAFISASASTQPDSRRAVANLELALGSFAAKSPRRFFAGLASLLETKPEQRFAAVTLVINVVRAHSQIAHHAIPARIFDVLILCALLDASIPVVQSAIFALCMFMCRNPAAMVQFHAPLVVVMARSLTLIFDQARLTQTLEVESTDAPSGLSPIPPPSIHLKPRPGLSSFVPSVAAADQPPLPRRSVQELIVYLYGLFPNNTLRFIRGPVTYLDLSEWTPPWSSAADQSEYAVLQLEHTTRRVSSFFEQIIVNPLLLTKLSDTEFSDLSRFHRAEPSSIVAYCEGLIADRTALAEPIEEISRPASRAEQFLSPTAMQQSASADQSSSRKTVISPPTTPAGRSSSAARAVGPRTSTPERNGTSGLDRHLALLRSELDYEIHLRDQHRQLMSSLAKENVARAGYIATQQTLNNELRYARDKLRQTSALLSKAHEEATKRKAMHETWNAEQRTKVGSLREEKRHWTEESVKMRMQIEELQATVKRQSEQLDQQSSVIFDLEAQTEHDAPQLLRVAELERRVQKLSHFLLAWDDDLDRQRIQRAQMDVLISEWQKSEQRDEFASQRIKQLSDQLDERDTEIESLQSELAIVRRRLDASDRLRFGQREGSTKRELEAVKAEFEAIRRRNIELETQVAGLSGADAANVTSVPSASE